MLEKGVATSIAFMLALAVGLAIVSADSNDQTEDSSTFQFLISVLTDANEKNLLSDDISALLADWFIENLIAPGSDETSEQVRTRLNIPEPPSFQFLISVLADANEKNVLPDDISELLADWFIENLIAPSSSETPEQVRQRLSVPTPTPVPPTSTPTPTPETNPLTDLIAIGSGEYNSCALREDGSLICWGAISGVWDLPQSGSDSHTWEPPGNETFVDLYVGWFNICTLRKDGSSMCWDDAGQQVAPEETRDYRRMAPAPAPRVPYPGGHALSPLPEFQIFTVASIGESGECSIRPEDGSAVCWSADLTGPVPVSTPTDERFTVISYGGQLYACAFDRDGSPLCWEYGKTSPPTAELFFAFSEGPGSTCALRLEDGSPVCWGLIAERAATLPEGETFIAISVGDRYACALREDGSPMCWGTATAMRPGDRAYPPADERFSSISSGRYHACGIRLEDGSPICWGLRYFTYDNGQAAPPGGERLQPLLPAGERFIAIDAGYLGHSCALRQDGSPACAGRGAAAQSAPPKGETFTVASSGFYHTCALRQDGSPVCWGPWFTSGQKFPDTLPPEGETFTAISSGMLHTCALRRGSSPVCWLGVDEEDNSSIRSIRLLAPPEGETFTTISSGDYHACALRQDGSPVCWMVIDPGVKGWDTRLIDPPEGETFTAISSGSFHTCALRQDGSPVCWMAIEVEGLDAAAFAPPEGENFTIIESGGSSVCALWKDGSPVCWGGSILFNPNWDYPHPNETFTDISVGFRQTCALREDGSHLCWGSY